MPLIFFMGKMILALHTDLSQLPQEDPVAQPLHFSEQLAVDRGCQDLHYCPPQCQQNSHCHTSKKSDSVKHLLPPIVLLPNHFSYKQGGLAWLGLGHKSTPLLRENVKVRLRLVHWGDRVHTVENSSNTERMSKRE